MRSTLLVDNTVSFPAFFQFSLVGAGFADTVATIDTLVPSLPKTFEAREKYGPSETQKQGISSKKIKCLLGD